MPAAVDAVVFTVTVALAAVPEVTWTVAGTWQVGPRFTDGLMLQARSTVPLNDPEGVIARLKVALLPGITVAEVGDPDAAAITKLFATAPVPESAMVCDPPPALSATRTDALAVPAAVGVKVTLMLQV